MTAMGTLPIIDASLYSGVAPEDVNIANQISSTKMDTTSVDALSPTTKMATNSTTGIITTNTYIKKASPSSFQLISLSPRSNESFRVLTEWPLMFVILQREKKERKKK